MKISEKERRKNKLNQDSLVQALRLLRECGYVILEAVLPSNWVEDMFRAYNEEVKRQFVGEKPTGHGGISAPLRMPFLDPLAIENPFAMQILKEAMGDDIFLTEVTLPGLVVEFNIFIEIPDIFFQTNHTCYQFH
ncbi:MAG: hypothetical protein NZ961_01435 [Candidatus Poribacteria bacterium]|nr:hypothetical protein [Candidatus Poribacteria bacterium]